MYIVEQPL